jgi:hypothetical protein
LPIGFTEDGKQFGVPPQDDDDNVTLGPPYRLFCERLPAKSEIVVHLATVVPVPLDNMSPEMWFSDRQDPSYIDLRSTYRAFGQSQEDRSRMKFEKRDRKGPAPSR